MGDKIKTESASLLQSGKALKALIRYARVEGRKRDAELLAAYMEQLVTKASPPNPR